MPSLAVDREDIVALTKPELIELVAARIDALTFNGFAEVKQTAKILHDMLADGEKHMAIALAKVEDDDGPEAA